MQSGFSKTIKACLWVVLPALVLATSPFVADSPCNGVEVSISIGETLTVQPGTVEIYIDAAGEEEGQVCWTVSGLAEGYTVHLAGKEGTKNLLPDLESTIQLPSTSASSGRPSGKGTWTYGVRVTHETKGTVMEVDPEVIIKEKGGSSHR